MKYSVELQINNYDPCPKRESRAWDWEEKKFNTLTECIEWIVEQQPAGWSITDSNNIIAEKHVSHFGILPRLNTE